MNMKWKIILQCLEFKAGPKVEYFSNLFFFGGVDFSNFGVIDAYRTT